MVEEAAEEAGVGVVGVAGERCSSSGLAEVSGNQVLPASETNYRSHITSARGPLMKEPTLGSMDDNLPIKVVEAPLVIASGTALQVDGCGGVVKIAVEADGPTHFSKNCCGWPLGSTQARNWLLRQLGWVVVCVPYDVWDGMGEDDKKVWLAGEIVKAVDKVGVQMKV
jgi:hypothetical protein